jgi:hypothetical protein
MSKVNLLRDNDMTGRIQGHFVSSFSVNGDARDSFAAYKNSLSSSVYTSRHVGHISVSPSSKRTLKCVEQQMLGKEKISPLFSSLNTRFSSEVRKRVVATLLVALSFLVVLIPASQAFGGLTLGSSKSSAAVSKNEIVKTVVVQSGDTLWSIARKLEPNQDPREVVDALVKARGTSKVMLGETIEWGK